MLIIIYYTTSTYLTHLNKSYVDIIINTAVYRLTTYIYCVNYNKRDGKILSRQKAWKCNLRFQIIIRFFSIKIIKNTIFTTVWSSKFNEICKNHEN